MSINESSAQIYDVSFFQYTNQVSKRSAEKIVPVLLELLPEIKSVVDFGAGEGTWLAVWLKNGLNDIQGIDGDYVDLEKLAIPRNKFYAADLNRRVNLGRTYDLAYSLEVAEHLNPRSSEIFVETLIAHSDMVLFSAAPLGQGGETHINERNMDYWRLLFLKRNFEAFDCVRPLIKDQKDIAYWYRYNTILYVHKNRARNLSPNILSFKIASEETIKDISPVIFKFRKAVVRYLPSMIQNFLARTKALIMK